MAQEEYAFIEKNRVPSAQQWQEAIDEAGYDLRLDEGLEPFAHSGFLPCQLCGSPTGVEVFYDSTEELFGAESPGDFAEGKDFCISFRSGGSFEEGACAMILSFALTRSFGAVVSYEGEPPYESLEAFQADIAEMLKEAERERRDEG